MHSRRIAAAFLTLVTLLLSPAILHAEGTVADKMCNPWHAECECGMEPNPKAKTDPKAPKCIKGANTNKCKEGICFDDTNDHYTTGICIAKNKCQALHCDGKTCGGKPAGENAGTEGSAGAPATEPPSGTVPTETTPTPTTPTPTQTTPNGGNGSNGGMPPTDALGNFEPRLDTPTAEKPNDPNTTVPTTNNFGETLQNANNNRGLFGDTIQNYFNPQDPFGANTPGIGNNFGAESSRSLLDQAVNPTNPTNSDSTGFGPLPTQTESGGWLESMKNSVASIGESISDFGQTLKDGAVAAVEGVRDGAVAAVDGIRSAYTSLTGGSTGEVAVEGSDTRGGVPPRADSTFTLEEAPPADLKPITNGDGAAVNTLKGDANLFESQGPPTAFNSTLPAGQYPVGPNIFEPDALREPYSPEAIAAEIQNAGSGGPPLDPAIAKQISDMDIAKDNRDNLGGLIDQQLQTAKTEEQKFNELKEKFDDRWNAYRNCGIDGCSNQERVYNVPENERAEFKRMNDELVKQAQTTEQAYAKGREMVDQYNEYDKQIQEAMKGPAGDVINKAAAATDAQVKAYELTETAAKMQQNINETLAQSKGTMFGFNRDCWGVCQSVTNGGVEQPLSEYRRASEDILQATQAEAERAEKRAAFFASDDPLAAQVARTINEGGYRAALTEARLDKYLTEQDAANYARNGGYYHDSNAIDREAFQRTELERLATGGDLSKQELDARRMSNPYNLTAEEFDAQMRRDRLGNGTVGAINDALRLSGYQTPLASDVQSRLFMSPEEVRNSNYSAWGRAGAMFAADTANLVLLSTGAGGIVSSIEGRLAAGALERLGATEFIAANENLGGRTFATMSGEMGTFENRFGSALATDARAFEAANSNELRLFASNDNAAFTGGSGIRGATAVDTSAETLAGRATEFAPATAGPTASVVDLEAARATRAASEAGSFETTGNLALKTDAVTGARTTEATVFDSQLFKANQFDAAAFRGSAANENLALASGRVELGTVPSAVWSPTTVALTGAGLAAGGTSLETNPTITTGAPTINEPVAVVTPGPGAATPGRTFETPETVSGSGERIPASTPGVETNVPRPITPSEYIRQTYGEAAGRAAEQAQAYGSSPFDWANFMGKGGGAGGAGSSGSGSGESPLVRNTTPYVRDPLQFQPKQSNPTVAQQIAQTARSVMNQLTGNNNVVRLPASMPPYIYDTLTNTSYERLSDNRYLATHQSGQTSIETAGDIAQMLTAGDGLVVAPEDAAAANPYNDSVLSFYERFAPPFVQDVSGVAPEASTIAERAGVVPRQGNAQNPLSYVRPPGDLLDQQQIDAFKQYDRAISSSDSKAVADAVQSLKNAGIEAADGLPIFTFSEPFLAQNGRVADALRQRIAESGANRSFSDLDPASELPVISDAYKTDGEPLSLPEAFVIRAFNSALANYARNAAAGGETALSQKQLSRAHADLGTVGLMQRARDGSIVRLDNGEVVAVRQGNPVTGAPAYAVTVPVDNAVSEFALGQADSTFVYPSPIDPELVQPSAELGVMGKTFGSVPPQLRTVALGVMLSFAPVPMQMMADAIGFPSNSIFDIGAEAGYCSGCDSPERLRDLGRTIDQKFYSYGYQPVDKFVVFQNPKAMTDYVRATYEAADQAGILNRQAFPNPEMLQAFMFAKWTNELSGLNAPLTSNCSSAGACGPMQVNYRAGTDRDLGVDSARTNAADHLRVALFAAIENVGKASRTLGPTATADQLRSLAATLYNVGQNSGRSTPNAYGNRIANNTHGFYDMLSGKTPVTLATVTDVNSFHLQGAGAANLTPLLKGGQTQFAAIRGTEPTIARGEGQDLPTTATKPPPATTVSPQRDNPISTFFKNNRSSNDKALDLVTTFKTANSGMLGTEMAARLQYAGYGGTEAFNAQRELGAREVGATDAATAADLTRADAAISRFLDQLRAGQPVADLLANNGQVPKGSTAIKNPDGTYRVTTPQGQTLKLTQTAPASANPIALDPNKSYTMKDLRGLNAPELERFLQAAEGLPDNRFATGKTIAADIDIINAFYDTFKTVPKINGLGRSVAVNNEVGGASNSDHLTGNATDWKTLGVPGKQVQELNRILQERGFDTITYPHGQGPHTHASLNRAPTPSELANLKVTQNLPAQYALFNDAGNAVGPTVAINSPPKTSIKPAENPFVTPDLPTMMATNFELRPNSNISWPKWELPVPQVTLTPTTPLEPVPVPSVVKGQDLAELTTPLPASPAGEVVRGPDLPEPAQPFPTVAVERSELPRATRAEYTYANPIFMRSLFIPPLGIRNYLPPSMIKKLNDAELNTESITFTKEELDAIQWAKMDKSAYESARMVLEQEGTGDYRVTVPNSNIEAGPQVIADGATNYTSIVNARPVEPVVVAEKPPQNAPAEPAKATVPQTEPTAAAIPPKTTETPAVSPDKTITEVPKELPASKPIITSSGISEIPPSATPRTKAQTQQLIKDYSLNLLPPKAATAMLPPAPAKIATLQPGSDPILSKPIKSLTQDQVKELAMKYADLFQDRLEEIYKQHGGVYRRAELYVEKPGDGSGFYPENGRIGIDLQQILNVGNGYSKTKASIIPYVVAHEIGHYVSRTTGVDLLAIRMKWDANTLPALNEATAYDIDALSELQADYIAGTLMKDTGVIKQGDLQDLYYGVAALGDDFLTSAGTNRETPRSFDGHGTGSLRSQMVHDGLRVGTLEDGLAFLSTEPNWTRAAPEIPWKKIATLPPETAELPTVASTGETPPLPPVPTIPSEPGIPSDSGTFIPSTPGETGTPNPGTQPIYDPGVTKEPAPLSPNTPTAPNVGTVPRRPEGETAPQQLPPNSATPPEIKPPTPPSQKPAVTEQATAPAETRTDAIPATSATQPRTSVPQVAPREQEFAPPAKLPQTSVPQVTPTRLPDTGASGAVNGPEPASPSETQRPSPSQTTPPSPARPTFAEQAKGAWDTTKTVLGNTWLGAKVARGTIFPASTIKGNIAINAITFTAASYLTGPFTPLTWPAMNAGYKYLLNRAYRADVNNLATKIADAIRSRASNTAPNAANGTAPETPTAANDNAAPSPRITQDNETPGSSGSGKSGSSGSGSGGPTDGNNQNASDAVKNALWNAIKTGIVLSNLPTPKLDETGKPETQGIPSTATTKTPELPAPGTNPNITYVPPKTGEKPFPEVAPDSTVKPPPAQKPPTGLPPSQKPSGSTGGSTPTGGSRPTGGSTPTGGSASTGGSSGSGIMGSIMSALSNLMKSIASKFNQNQQPQPQNTVPTGPITVTMYAQPNPVDLGASTTVSWMSTNAKYCRVFAYSGETKALGSPDSSFVTQPISTTTLYRIVCGNGSPNVATSSVLIRIK